MILYSFFFLSLCYITCDAKVIAEMSKHGSSLRNIVESPIFFSLEEQHLNYKFCTSHIFLERIWEERKAQKQTPLKTFLQLYHWATSFFFISTNFSNTRKRWKNTFNGTFYSIQSTLCNRILKFKFTPGFNRNTLLFLEETE